MQINRPLLSSILIFVVLLSHAYAKKAENEEANLAKLAKLNETGDFVFHKKDITVELTYP